jgi:hypothetical protein
MAVIIYETTPPPTKRYKLSVDPGELGSTRVDRGAGDSKTASGLQAPLANRMDASQQLRTYDATGQFTEAALR